jgi:ATP-binding cassette subfamily B protein
MSRRKQKLKEIAPKLRDVYVYFWPDIRDNKPLIASSLLALFLSVLFRLLEPWPLKIFIDDVLGGKTTWGLSPQSLLVVVAASVVIIVSCRALADYASRVGFFVVGNRVVIKVRNRLYRHLQRLPVAFHRKKRTGDIVIRLTRDVSLLRDVTATAMLPLVASTAVLLGMLLVMSYLSWQLTLLALLTLPLFWTTTLRIGRRIRESSRKQRQREGAMATTAAEAMSAIEVIKAMSLEERFASIFNRSNSASQKEDLKASRLSVKLGRTIDILLALSTALVLWFGGTLALQGQLTAGDVVVFLAYLKRSFKPAQEFAKYVARLAKAAAAGERVIEILNEHSSVEEPAATVAAPEFEGRIHFDRVSFAFDASQPVLDGLEFSAEPGELVAMVGPSGSGKSTVLGHILRFFDPIRGKITIDGTDLADVSVDSVRNQISCVMQEPLLFADTVFQNIACGATDATTAQVEEAAHLANAHDFICQMPAGYDTVLGERGGTLSRGQRQRIAVARATIRTAPILLLDEPTTGLDEENEQIVVDALLKLAHGRTTILVTHNLTLASHADQILFLDHGRLVESGNHDILMAKHGRYARWFGEQLARSKRHTTKLSVVS